MSYSFALYDHDDEGKPLPRKLLGEGGNAIKSSSRIPAECIKPTIFEVFKTLFPSLKVNIDNIALLGSTAKKKSGEDAGDLDIGIDINAIMRKNNLTDRYDALHIVEAYIKRYTEFKAMRALNVYSFAYPIINENNEKTGKYVQIDLMPVSSIPFAKWTYFSPTSEQSAYKGLYRNEVIFAILKNVDYDVLAKDLDGKPTIWSRYTLDLSRGLFRNKQKATSAGGNRTEEKKFVTDDPEVITHMMFGDSVNANEILTFEQIINKVFSDDFIHKDKRDIIIKDVEKGIKSKRVPYPDFLKYKFSTVGNVNGTIN